MLVTVVPLGQLARKLSTKVSAHEIDTALSWVQRTACSRMLSGMESRVYYCERPWISATKVVVHGQANESGVKANALIRWLQYPERSCSVIFDTDDDLYTIQVKAVYYAIVSAMFHRVSHAVIYSPNEIVVKVGSGVYKAKKEVRLFKGIQSRTGLSRNGCDTCVRLCLLDNDALRRLKWSRECAFSREKIAACSENMFREQHCSEILRL